MGSRLPTVLIFLKAILTFFAGPHLSLPCGPTDKKGREEDRKLQLNEYSPTFVRWAQCYLQYKPASIIEAGGSLADLLIQKITGRQSATHLEIQAAKREEKR